MPIVPDPDTYAAALLRQPERFSSLPKRDARERTLLLWRTPSFEPWSAWALFERPDACWVRRLEYDRLRQPRIGGAQAQVYGAEAPIARARCEALVWSFATLDLPAVPGSPHGIDGVSYGVAVGHRSNAGRWRWWEDPGEAWRPLTLAFAQAAEALDASLPASTLRQVARHGTGGE